METQDLKEKVENLTSHTGDYLDTLYKVTMLNVTQKATNIASAAIGAITICILGMFVLFFIGFGAAWWLGDMINSRTGGFLIVAGFYLVLTICIVALRRKIVFPFFRNLLIKKVYE